MADGVKVNIDEIIRGVNVGLNVVDMELDGVPQELWDKLEKVNVT